MEVEWKKITKQFYGFYLLQTWYQPQVVSESVSLCMYVCINLFKVGQIYIYEYEYKTSTVPSQAIFILWFCCSYSSCQLASYGLLIFNKVYVLVWMHI